MDYDTLVALFVLGSLIAGLGCFFFVKKFEWGFTLFEILGIGVMFVGGVTLVVYAWDGIDAAQLAALWRAAGVSSVSSGAIYARDTLNSCTESTSVCASIAQATLQGGAFTSQEKADGEKVIHYMVSHPESINN